jgi:uncharacterized protein
LKTLTFDEQIIAYDGTQLAPHWIYRTFDIMGNALVAFVGPADVKISEMVDIEDVKKKAPIYSPRMLHFLGEWFQDSFEVGILLQHLFVSVVYETLLESKHGAGAWYRRGNDIYFDSRKLSVSICTKTLVSTLIHVGINIETEGTPIPTSGLLELGINYSDFSLKVLNKFESDYECWAKARVKVLSR